METLLLDKDDQTHLTGLRFCRQLGLDYAVLYEQAYAHLKDEDPEGSSGDWLREFETEVPADTVVPALTNESVRAFLDDLTDINNHSLREVMEREFARLGYAVEVTKPEHTEAARRAFFA